MAQPRAGFAAKRGIEDAYRASVEQSELPILCESCLGPNPYVRMTKEPWGRECRVCERPFAVFRWKPGGDGTRYKKTEICQTCARLKNVCQTCLFDLKHGLPVQIRDLAMAKGDVVLAHGVVESGVNREYVFDEAERKVASGEIDNIYKGTNEEGKSDVGRLIPQLTRKGPAYERNLAKICTFWVRGGCKRGYYCPYRHEMPLEESEMEDGHGIKDRYFGVRDPLALKMLGRVQGGLSRLSSLVAGGPEPPEDEAIKELYVGQLPRSATEREITRLFEEYGGVERVHLVTSKSFGFVTFVSRTSAEEAVKNLWERATLDGQKLNIQWSRRRPEAGPATMTQSGPVANASEGNLLPNQGIAVSQEVAPFRPERDLGYGGPVATSNATSQAIHKMMPSGPAGKQARLLPEASGPYPSQKSDRIGRPPTRFGRAHE